MLRLASLIFLILASTAQISYAGSCKDRCARQCAWTSGPIQFRQCMDSCLKSCRSKHNQPSDDHAATIYDIIPVPLRNVNLISHPKQEEAKEVFH